MKSAGNWGYEHEKKLEKLILIITNLFSRSKLEVEVRRLNQVEKLRRWRRSMHDLTDFDLAQNNWRDRRTATVHTSRRPWLIMHQICGCGKTAGHNVSEFPPKCNKLESWQFMISERRTWLQCLIMFNNRSFEARWICAPLINHELPNLQLVASWREFRYVMLSGFAAAANLMHCE